MTMKKRILVVVVTYNGMNWLDRCLGSIRTSNMPADVIVIDNGSTDQTREYIFENFPEVKLVCSDENLGFGKANNIGFKYALERGYEYVYLLNQDAWIFPDTLGVLINAMEADESLGILSPMQMAACGYRPDPRFKRRCPTGAFSDMRSLLSAGKVYEVEFVMAAHWMISMKCLKKVGGFSPAFPHYGEDDNFIHRARYKGFKVGIHSGAKAIHDRENRPMSKETHMSLKCIGAVVKISNPLNLLWVRKILVPVQLLAAGIWYRSLYLIKFIPTLLHSYKKLSAYRLESFKDGAFLGF